MEMGAWEMIDAFRMEMGAWAKEMIDAFCRCLGQTPRHKISPATWL
jgi:hypothetical protein